MLRLFRYTIFPKKSDESSLIGFAAAIPLLIMWIIHYLTQGYVANGQNIQIVGGGPEEENEYYNAPWILEDLPRMIDVVLVGLCGVMLVKLFRDSEHVFSVLNTKDGRAMYDSYYDLAELWAVGFVFLALIVGGGLGSSDLILTLSISIPVLIGVALVASFFFGGFSTYVLHNALIGLAAGATLSGGIYYGAITLLVGFVAVAGTHIVVQFTSPSSTLLH